jgi:hypothetical protein
MQQEGVNVPVVEPREKRRRVNPGVGCLGLLVLVSGLLAVAPLTQANFSAAGYRFWAMHTAGAPPVVPSGLHFWKKRAGVVVTLSLGMGPDCFSWGLERNLYASQ